MEHIVRQDGDDEGKFGDDENITGSGQLNPGIFSSGINVVAHEDMEPSSVKLLSGSAVHSTMGSGMGSHNFEAVPSSFSSAPAPELHVPEYSSVPKISKVI
uniref:Uncharacterized protein n=2 Tax=Helianthus annuus TaxID=4232 RepID=A0A251U8H3_HELAN